MCWIRNLCRINSDGNHKYQNINKICEPGKKASFDGIWWYAKWEFDIIISFLAKIGSVGPVEQQIKFVSPNWILVIYW